VTGENQRRNAQEEIARAETCLKEAQALQSAGFPYGAVSRAYYAVFHAARALLFSLGLEAKTHKAVVSLVGEHFVRTGALPPAMGRLISRMQRDREDADYEPAAVFTGEEAETLIAGAWRFLEESKRIVRTATP
jgi:uncharacterized protein